MSPSLCVRLFRLTAVAALALLAVSCSSAVPTETPSQADGRTAETSTPTERVPPETPQAAAACRPPSDDPPQPSADLFQQPQSITNFLNQGGDLDRLLDAADKLGLLPQFAGALRGATGDLDGDHRTDIAFSLRTPQAEPALPIPGALLLWLCRDGGYVLQETVRAGESLEAPVLFGAFDLTGDGLGEVVYGRPSCGAHTCFLSLSVLQWDGKAFVDRWNGSSEDLPNPSVSIQPALSGGNGSVSLTSGGVSSVGAGPPRPRTRIWTWDPTRRLFLAGTDLMSAPVYRIHVVHDADSAFEAGDSYRARALYRRALEDASLLEWEAGPAIPAALMGYVDYRLVLLALTQGGHEAAQSAYDAMVEATSGVPEAEGYLAMARILAGYSDPIDGAAACEEVRRYAASHPDLTLDPLYYGYDNRVYSTVDLCPLK